MRERLQGWNFDRRFYPTFSPKFQELLSTWPCSSCGQSISPDGHDGLMVGDVRFHHACLECEVCRKKMEGKVVTLEKDNMVYCTEDYNIYNGKEAY